MADVSLVALDGLGASKNIAMSDNSSVLTPYHLAIQSGAWAVSISDPVAVTGSFWQAVQPVSGNLTTVTTVTTVGTVTTLTGSSVAHDAVDSGNPHKMGAKAVASTAAGTNVAANDRANLVSDLDGALIIRQDTPVGDYISGNATDTTGNSTSCIAAQGAGIKTHITDVTLTNSSATNITVELKDGTTTKWTFPVPANGGVTHHFRTPIIGSANAAWNFDGSAAATTLTCSLSGYKTKL